MAPDSSPHHLPTRADVARYAGVSDALVSYVMNGGPRPVAPETAERVRAAIDVLGYRPNLSARALKRGSNQLLGIMLAPAHRISTTAPRHGHRRRQQRLGARSGAALAPELFDGADHWAVLRLFQQPVDGPCAVGS